MKIGFEQEINVSRKEHAFWLALLVSVAIHLLFLSVAPFWGPGHPGGLYMIEGGVIDMMAETAGETTGKISHAAKAMTASAKPAEKARVEKKLEKKQAGTRSEVITSARGLEKLAEKPAKKPGEKPTKKPAKKPVEKESQGQEAAAGSQPPDSKGAEESKGMAGQPGGKGLGSGSGPGAGAGPGMGAGSGDGSGTGKGGFGVLGGQELLALGKAIVYPKNAQNEGVTGTVILKVFVTTGGATEKVTVEKSSGDARLDTQAVKTVAGQSFRPAAKNYIFFLKIAFEEGGVVSASNYE